MAELPEELVAAVEAHPAYQELIRRRTRLGWVLTGIVLAAFFGFTLITAFDKAWLAAPIGAGVTSIGIPIGFGIILLAISLTAVYVWRANSEYDALIRRVLDDVTA